MHLFRIGVAAPRGVQVRWGGVKGGYTENNNIFSPSKQRDICALVCMLWHNDFIVYVCGCATDFTLLIIFRLCPLHPLYHSLPPLPLPLSCYVCLFFYTDWCIFRSVLTRLEPCGFGFGFGFGPLLFGSHCGFLPLAHAKQKRGGHSQIEFCGTRATLSTKKV